MGVLSKIFTLRGRMNRARYAAWLSCSFGVMLAPSIVYPFEMGPEIGLLEAAMIDPALIPTMAAVVIGLAMQVIAGWRRAHDMNTTGWIALGSLLLFLAVPLYVVLLAVRGTTGANRYGEAPAPATEPAAA